MLPGPVYFGGGQLYRSEHGGAIYDGSTPHTYWCGSASDCSTTYCSESAFLGSCIGYNEPARDGMDCGSGKHAARPPSTRTWTSRPSRWPQPRRASTSRT